MGTNFIFSIKQIFKTITMILSWTVFALLLLIIGFLAYYLICTNIYASKGEKFEPKFSLYTIVSPSMEPNIKVYDVILNTRVDDAADIKVGDVITFISTSNISNGMTVTHRVTKIVQGPNGLEFKTKGDNNLSEDTDTAKAANVLGKVFLKIPQLGRLQFFLSSNGGWLIVIVCPALFIIVNDIFKILKLSKAKKAITEAEKEEIDDEKIKLESFRKEEIKEKLNKKELKKANTLADKIKKDNGKKSELKEDLGKEKNKEASITTVDVKNKKKKNKKETTNAGKKELSKEKSAKNQNKKKEKSEETIEKYNIFGDIKEESNIFSNNYKSTTSDNKKNKNSNKKNSVEIKTENQFELPKLKKKK